MAAIPLLIALGGPSLIDGAALPVWAGVLGYLVVRDLLEFLFHRAQHTVPWMWSMHSLHHSDPDMSALTTSRHFWAEPLIKAVTIWPLAALASFMLFLTALRLNHEAIHHNLGFTPRAHRFGSGWGWLVQQGGKGAQTDDLADLLWPEADSMEAAKNRLMLAVTARDFAAATLAESSAEVDAERAERADGLGREAALRGTRFALHEQDYVIGGQQRFDAGAQGGVE